MLESSQAMRRGDKVSTTPPAEMMELAESLIRRRAAQLCRRKRFQRDEREDIEQDLWVAVLKQLKRFDAAQGAAKPFLHRIISQAATELIRKRARAPREVSLTDYIAEEWEGSNTIAQFIECDAIRDALCQMPEHLRDICEKLMAGKNPGVIDFETYEEIRSYLEEAGYE